MPVILQALVLTSNSQSLLDSGDHFAAVNGIKIHYFVRGKGPVCLLPSPGWGLSISYLKNSLQPFDKYFTMVYYDSRRSGRSTGPDDSTKYTSDDFLQDMDALRNYLNQPKVWTMGHSAGGFQVLNYATHYEDHISGVIVIDAVVADDSLHNACFEQAVLSRKGKSYYEKGAGILLGTDTTKHSPFELLMDIFPFYFHNQDYIQKTFQIGAAEVNPRTMAWTQKCRFSQQNLIPYLHTINVPTLILVGDDDFICDKRSQADRISKNITSSSEVVIKDAGHLCWLEQPDQFFTASGDWLEKHNVKANP